MNVTFQLVNHMTRKMTHTRLPPGVTYTPGSEKSPTALQNPIVYAPPSTREECFLAPSPGLGPLRRGRTERALRAAGFVSCELF